MTLLLLEGVFLNVGFVILTWNSEKVVERCLKSIFSMHNIYSEVVVIDNGSTDNTKKIISSMSSDNNNSIMLICNSENLGTTLTRNVGLKFLQDKGVDFYCILDSDTEINEIAILKLAKEMNLHSEYGIIGPKMVTSTGIVQMSARAFPTLIEKIFKGMPIPLLQRYGEKLEKQNVSNSNDESYPVDYLMSACWLIRPDALDKVGYLDEKIFYAPEDAEYCIRMWKSGYKVAFCPKAQIIHEWQRLSKRKLISKMNWEHIKGLVYMFAKHHYFLSLNKLRKSFPIEKY